MNRIAYKAIEITVAGTLRTLGMANARKTQLKLGDWLEDLEHGFTAAKALHGAEQVVDIATNRKRKQRPHKTAIAIIQGEQVLEENRWAIRFRRIRILDIVPTELSNTWRA